MEPFIGQIMMVGFNFAPRGWATCDGQTLPINQNTALFSLLGTTYGGDGRTTFRLPDLRGRNPLHVGTGPGLPSVSWGQQGGDYQHTLTVSQLPSHSHNASVPCDSEEGSTDDPDGKYPAVNQEEQYSDNNNAAMGAFSTEPVGGGQPFEIRNPFLGIHFVIALTGIFPSRS
jgi:microcystin-dependent protein